MILLPSTLSGSGFFLCLTDIPWETPLFANVPLAERQYPVASKAHPPQAFHSVSLRISLCAPADVITATEIPLFLRDLYQILHHNQRVVGTWRGLGYGSKGALFHFRWRPSCIEGVRVACGPGADEAHLEPFYTFDGRFGGAVTSFLDEGMCTVEVVPGGIRQECSPLPSCSRAEAAAIVAGGSGVSHLLLLDPS